MTIITKITRASLGRKLLIALPMVWLLIFFLAPFIVIFKISFSEVARALPPLYALVFLARWHAGYIIKPIQLRLFMAGYAVHNRLFILHKNRVFLYHISVINRLPDGLCDSPCA